MAKVNSRQTGKVAKLLGELPNESCGLNFYSHETGRKEIVASRMYPALNHPQAINFFFFVCLHQYGFWHGDENGYREPIFGCLDDKKLKGSDLLWAACKKALDNDPLIFERARLAKISFDGLLKKSSLTQMGRLIFRICRRDTS